MKILAHIFICSVIFDFTLQVLEQTGKLKNNIKKLFFLGRGKSAEI